MTPTLTDVLAEHKPVVGRFAHLNAVVGCTCLDRVFYAGRENYQSHLRDVFADWLRDEAQVEAVTEAALGYTYTANRVIAALVERTGVEG